MNTAIDWPSIARAVGALKENPDGTRREKGGSTQALRALEIILGEREMAAAVDYYVDRRPGAELVRSVLWQLRPWSAMQRCYDIFLSDADIERRISAVELIRVVADHRAIPWITEFLASDVEGIQTWGIGVIDQMLFGGGVDRERLRAVLQGALDHRTEYVRTHARKLWAEYFESVNCD